MDPAQLIAVMRLYLEVNLLLAIAYLILRLARRAERWGGGEGSSIGWLRLGQVLFVLALLLPPLASMLPGEALPRPSAQIWSGTVGTARSGTPAAVIAPIGSWMTGAAKPELRVSLTWIALSGAVFGVIGLLFLGRLAGQLRRLRSMLREMPLMRRQGRVRVQVSDDHEVPFSAWLPGWSYVVVPASMLCEPERVRLAVQHELQHHRQGDTRWLHLVALCQALCAWNPVLYSWSRWFSEMQEFACDEHLVGRRRVSPQAYGRCLVETARAALEARRVLAGTASMASASSGPLLKRRIEMLFAQRVPTRRWLTLVITLGTIGLLTGSALASRGAVQDRTLSLEQAHALAQKTTGRDIPVVVDEQVLAKLNAYVGTEKGREFMRKALKRMPDHQAAIEKKLAEHGLPRELLAVPLLESGYKNLPETSTEPSLAPGMRGAGIWMFIPQTARVYGLKVDDKVDERLDPAKETEAACLYFAKVYKEFGDWHLALAAYNMGEKAVNKAIAESGSRDAARLVRDGKLNDYLPTFMAALIIMKNPSLLD